MTTVRLVYLRTSMVLGVALLAIVGILAAFGLPEAMAYPRAWSMTTGVVAIFLAFAWTAVYRRRLPWSGAVTYLAFAVLTLPAIAGLADLMAAFT